MIEAIFFDFDGVVTRESSGSRNICENLNDTFPDVPVETALAHYKQDCSSLLVGARLDDVWGIFCRNIGHQISPDLRATLLRTVTRNEDVWALALSLRRRYKIGMITDNGAERMALLDHDMHLSDHFDPLIVSANVAALKHDGTTTIFDAALRGAKCTADQSVFIDNQQRNLEMPKQMGMHTIWHDDKKNDGAALRQALRDCGVDVY